MLDHVATRVPVSSAAWYGVCAAARVRACACLLEAPVTQRLVA